MFVFRGKDGRRTGRPPEAGRAALLANRSALPKMDGVTVGVIRDDVDRDPVVLPAGGVLRDESRPVGRVIPVLVTGGRVSSSSSRRGSRLHTLSAFVSAVPAVNRCASAGVFTTVGSPSDAAPTVPPPINRCLAASTNISFGSIYSASAIPLYTSPMILTASI